MTTTQLFYLLPNQPLVTPPVPGTALSASTAAAGVWTPHLLDPALPVSGSAQQLETLNVNLSVAAATNYLCVAGRWLTRPLPAQTIAAGNWLLSAGLRVQGTSSPGTNTFTTWGFTLAQWRPGSGVIARLVDTPAAGTTYSPSSSQEDAIVSTTIAGSGVTLVTGDCLALEVWTQYHTVTAGTLTAVLSLLYNGLEQPLAPPLTPGSVLPTIAALTSMGALLVAPSGITYS